MERVPALMWKMVMPGGIIMCCCTGMEVGLYYQVALILVGSHTLLAHLSAAVRLQQRLLHGEIEVLLMYKSAASLVLIYNGSRSPASYLPGW